MFQSTVLAVIMIIVGFVTMRLVGRKSLSKMTVSQAVIMIAIGSILVEPVKEKNFILTVISMCIFVGVLLLLEWLTYYSEKFERWFLGESKLVVSEGKILHENLKKLRMTEDMLEMIFRTKGITSLDQIEKATLEPNGHVGYELREKNKGINKQDLEDFKIDIREEFLNLYSEIQQVKNKLNKENQNG